MGDGFAVSKEVGQSASMDEVVLCIEKQVMLTGDRFGDKKFDELLVAPARLDSNR